MQMDNHHSLTVRDWILPLYAQGKDLEVRVDGITTRNIGTGDIIIINGELSFLVKDRRRYDDFDEMLSVEKPERILPGYPKEAILRFLREIYRSRESDGVLVFELEEYKSA